MATIVLLGGNGYIGREVTRQWLAKDRDARFVVVSGSGTNQLKDARITNVKADATDVDTLEKALPAKFDAIVDFIGRPCKDAQDNIRINVEPAKGMQRLAEERGARAMGYIGGVLGPKRFTRTKAEMVHSLKQSSVPLAYVEPTIVYGGGRSDAMSKMVPLLKVVGKFVKNCEPVKVEDVAADLVGQLTKLLG
ncbi:MAG: NAD(P)H-binding protein [Bifidobacterium sp.]|nr:NAD(P)H-binding protein [Bifidobacterium sp.]